ASGAHRLAACIAGPGPDGIWTGFVEMAKQAGLPQNVVDALPRASQDTLAALRAGIDASPHAKWGVMKRGFWVNGADNLGDWLEAVAPFTLGDRARGIRFPTPPPPAPHPPPPPRHTAPPP